MLLDGGDQAALFAHCASFGVNALWEPTSRYDGRVSAHGVERRLAHSHVLARAVDLDMVAAGWKPTVENYLGRVAKPRILMAVAEAKDRSEEHTSELQSLMRISYAVFCLKKKNNKQNQTTMKQN